MNYFVVFDFETDGVDPQTCCPVQVASVTIDPYNLEILDNSVFCSNMRPLRAKEEGYWDDPKVKKTIEWHANNRKVTSQEIVEEWKDAPETELVWKQFVQHINKYNPKKTQTNAPHFCGANIKNFDLPIADRLNELCKIKKLYNHKYVDIVDLAFLSIQLWDNSVYSVSMDTLRPYLGLSSEGSHEALKDVYDEAKIVQKYLNFFKRTFEISKFKGCLKK